MGFWQLDKNLEDLRDQSFSFPHEYCLLFFGEVTSQCWTWHYLKEILTSFPSPQIEKKLRINSCNREIPLRRDFNHFRRSGHQLRVVSADARCQKAQVSHVLLVNTHGHGWGAKAGERDPRLRSPRAPLGEQGGGWAGSVRAPGVLAGLRQTFASALTSRALLHLKCYEVQLCNSTFSKNKRTNRLGELFHSLYLASHNHDWILQKEPSFAVELLGAASAFLTLRSNFTNYLSAFPGG